tara:strand:+ start:416 stop:613 length:198 start_codon:yes stop_codon:yes gene_type:complete
MASKDKNNALKVSSVIFGIVALLHLVRVIQGGEMIVFNWSIPMAASWLGVLIAGGLCWWTWTASH